MNVSVSQVEGGRHTQVEGVFALWKPVGISSQRAVQKVKYWARAQTGEKKIRVGHGGTLDPLAEGVLIIAVGRTYTRQIEQHVAAEKEYIAQITLGETSATDDAEGEKTLWPHEVVIPDEAAVIQAVGEFVGDIDQVPPAYSAIKLQGQEAYKRVRRGEEVKMQSRTVHIEKIEVLSYSYPFVSIRVICGKGTYIRSLARDIGTALNTGAYMSALTRTRVGAYTQEQCRKIVDFE